MTTQTLAAIASLVIGLITFAVLFQKTRNSDCPS